MSDLSSKFDLASLPLSRLRLDPDNPRIPVEMQQRDQDSLLRYVADAFNVIEVGRSIASHGYFPSEPLIAIPEAGTDKFTVVEGNRRLVALRILDDPTLALGLTEEAEWKDLAQEYIRLGEVPVVVAEKYDDVAPIIGYRHISGIKPWEPFEKARFIAKLAEENHDLREVASIVGDSRTNVASHYRNYMIENQAREEFELDTRPVKEDFGVFTRAMSQVAIRNYISAPAPAPGQVAPNRKPLPTDKRGETQELFSWLFGDNEHDAVINESRDIPRLAKVLESDHGIDVLRETRDLAQARQAAGGPRARLTTLLKEAVTSLSSARGFIYEFREDPEVVNLVGIAQERLDDLRSVGDSDNVSN